MKPRIRLKQTLKVPEASNAQEPCKRMCKSCAYKQTPSEDEEEYERHMFIERDNKPHLCHNDHDYFCKGSWEFTKRLGLHSNGEEQS